MNKAIETTQLIASSYIFRRIMLIFPTLIGILLVNFIIIQASPGGPVDQAVARIMGEGVAATAQIGGGGGSSAGGAGTPGGESSYEFARGLDPELIAELEKQFGFDKPAHIRFLMMMRDYFSFEFGNSYYQDIPVIDLIAERLPVSLSLGIASLLIVYSVSLPLGIRKAVTDGTPFDVWSSVVILVGYAIPAFVLAMLLIIVFCGGEFFNWFPLRGLISDTYEDLSVFEKIKDRIWHIAMPVTAMVAGSFATLTMLTKNSFLEEINKQYVLTARAKGLAPRRILYGHVFRNAMLIVIAGFPAVFVSVFFGSSLIIETIFSLDGLGRMGFEAAVARDYPVVFGTLFIFSLIGLVIGLISDLMYVWIDPRIDFESRLS